MKTLMTKRTTKIAGLAAIGLTSMLALTGCSGSSLDGTYFADNGDDSSYYAITIDGNKVMAEEMWCNKSSKDDWEGDGTLTEDKTQIMWQKTEWDGEFRNKTSSPVSISKDGTIDLEGYGYVKSDSEIGQQMVKMVEESEYCKSQ